MSRRRFGIMSTWFHQARAAHDRELGAPQPFPLTGDGDYLAAAAGGKWDGGKLADARYRDWLAQRPTTTPYHGDDDENQTGADRAQS